MNIVSSTSLHDSTGTAFDRALDVAVGGGIALLSYLLWPPPPRAGVDATLATLIAALARYVRSVSDFVLSGDPPLGNVRESARATRLSWAASDASVGSVTLEPKVSAQVVVVDRGLLAAAPRCFRAAHALRLDAERGNRAGASAPLTGLIEILGEELSLVAAKLRGQIAPQRVPELR